MVNRNGVRYPETQIKIPDGWEVVKKWKGMILIRPIEDMGGLL